MIKEILLHTINVERKEIRNYILGLTIAFAFLSIIGTYKFEIKGTTEIIYNSAIGFMQLVILVLFMFASPNWVFRFRKTCPATIQYLMLPASNLEKFIAKMIFSYVGYILMCLVAVMLADAVQAAYHLIIYNEAKSITRLLLEEGNMVLVTGMYKDLPYFIVFAIWVHSIYTLGASFFRTHSFIKTSGIMFVLTIVFNGFITDLMMSSLENLDSTYQFLTDNEKMLDAAYFSGLSLLSLLIYYLAYRRFSRITVLI